MKIQALLLPGAALGAAALLLTPTESQGFTTIGGSLNLSQRDFRVFDNFQDATANDNQTEDPQFPGWVGVELAVWKGTIEWGSLHGDGTGDPTQPDLGSGGADFDSTWQGEATMVGGSNDNIVSAIGSCGGSTLAFTETPISDGWRIRFCDNVAWDDGPGFISSPRFDIQEVQAHEYGHALGLGHSADQNATMRPGTSAGSEAQRSINADDIAGVQFIYGAASANKVQINSVSGTGQITIIGSGFDQSATNSVWFTRRLGTGGGTGAPVAVNGLGGAAGGTVIFVTAPADAGPGDILVRASGATGDRLSNPMPFDPDPPDPVTYCFGKISSAFCGPFITWTGFPSATDTTPFQIIGNDIVPNQFGFLIYGINGRSNLNFHNGKLCVKAPFTRFLPPKNSGSPGMGFCPGELTTNFNKRIQSGVDVALTVGRKVNAQWLYRDPGVDQFNDGLTDGIEFVIAP